ncbi:hypothetical protein EON65_14000 [archaeon]|nr:MAG: hypothetical protein EON65_14000 [archaeon]
MAVEPNACDALSLCASEEGVFQVNFFNALIMVILLIVSFGSSCLFSRRQRKKYAESSTLDPSSRSVTDKAGQATTTVPVSSGLIHVQFKDLVYEVGHGHVVLPGISGDIPAGQITALLGPTAW